MADDHFLQDTDDELSLPHPVDLTADQTYADGLVNSNNWVDYAFNTYHDFEGMMGYLLATRDLTNHLRSLTINSTSSTLEEFKTEILALCNDRSNFTEHVNSISDPSKIWFDL